MKPENKVKPFGGNGLVFETDSENRPCIQDIDDGEFILYTNTGSITIYKKDINDLIILLQEVKAHGYKIDY